LLPELSRTLERDTKLRLDDLTLLENQTKSLSLQTQWAVVEVNKQFMFDHHVALQSPAFCKLCCLFLISTRFFL
jgi:hypothetical protein